VKRVVITSSFASILNGSKGNSTPDKTYSEADWNPITEEEALKDPLNGYRGTFFGRSELLEAKDRQQVRLLPKRPHGHSKGMRNPILRL
jgi:hypothetical protein